MNRFTDRDGLLACGSEYEECKTEGKKCVYCDKIDEAIERLFAYEETGLTPEEVSELARVSEEKSEK